jgi:hypothetical protein
MAMSKTKRLRRLGIAALVVGGSAAGASAIGGSADAVPSCPTKTPNIENLIQHNAQMHTQLSACDAPPAGLQVIGKINLQKIAEERNSNASSANLGSVRLPVYAPPKIP